MPLLVVPVLLLVALALCVGIVVASLANMLLHPPRMTDGKAMYRLRRMSPSDLGVPFEPVRFEVADASSRGGARRLSIAGWWIPAAVRSDRTCVLVHGFADAKIGAIAWAPIWRELGWNLLAIDLRAHGDSGGTQCSGAYYEREDLDQVLNALRARRPDQARHLALFGISLGGAVVLATAARRDDITAVVADSVYSDYRRAALVHGKLIGAPLVNLTPLAIRIGERIARADFDEARPLKTIGEVRCPIALFHGDADPFVPDEDVVALADAIHARNDSRDLHHVTRGATHCRSMEVDPDGYAKALRDFLDKGILQQPSS